MLPSSAAPRSDRPCRPRVLPFAPDGDAGACVCQVPGYRPGGEEEEEEEEAEEGKE